MQYKNKKEYEMLFKNIKNKKLDKIINDFRFSNEKKEYFLFRLLEMLFIGECELEIFIIAYEWFIKVCNEKLDDFSIFQMIGIIVSYAIGFEREDIFKFLLKKDVFTLEDFKEDLLKKKESDFFKSLEGEIKDFSEIVRIDNDEEILDFDNYSF